MHVEAQLQVDVLMQVEEMWTQREMVLVLVLVGYACEVHHHLQQGMEWE